jgi:hypothetical protein
MYGIDSLCERYMKGNHQLIKPSPDYWWVGIIHIPRENLLKSSFYDWESLSIK